MSNPILNLQPPIPGYWYSTVGDKLVQVRATRYDKGVLVLVALEYIGGERSFISPTKWAETEIILHSPVDTRQSA